MDSRRVAGLILIERYGDIVYYNAGYVQHLLLKVQVFGIQHQAAHIIVFILTAPLIIHMEAYILQFHLFQVELKRFGGFVFFLRCSTERIGYKIIVPCL